MADAGRCLPFCAEKCGAGQRKRGQDPAGATKMYVSGGKLGMQLKLAPEDFKIAAKASYADVIRKVEK